MRRPARIAAILGAASLSATMALSGCGYDSPGDDGPAQNGGGSEPTSDAENKTENAGRFEY